MFVYFEYLGIFTTTTWVIIKTSDEPIMSPLLNSGRAYSLSIFLSLSNNSQNFAHQIKRTIKSKSSSYRRLFHFAVFKAKEPFAHFNRLNIVIIMRTL